LNVLVGQMPQPVGLFGVLLENRANSGGPFDEFGGIDNACHSDGIAHTLVLISTFVHFEAIYFSRNEYRQVE
jgi:hypothetical protein